MAEKRTISKVDRVELMKLKYPPGDVLSSVADQAKRKDLLQRAMLNTGGYRPTVRIMLSTVDGMRVAEVVVTNVTAAAVSIEGTTKTIPLRSIYAVKLPEKEAPSS